jgi:predicted lipid carrier protein YhbT
MPMTLKAIPKMLSTMMTARRLSQQLFEGILRLLVSELLHDREFEFASERQYFDLTIRSIDDQFCARTRASWLRLAWLPTLLQLSLSSLF